MRRRMGRLSPLLLAVAIAQLPFASEAPAADLAPWQLPVATTVMRSRAVTNLAANDFIRLIFVPATASVSSLGLRQARVFMAATSFLRVAHTSGASAPLSLSTVAGLTGGQYSPTLDLAAMRCQLPDAAHSAILASWPNVIAAVRSDLTGFACHPMPSNPSAENQVFCLAEAFRDRPDAMAVKPLAEAIDTGRDMMQVSDSTGHTGAEVLGSTYGIGLGFSGLGFSIAGSLNTSLNAAKSLQQSVMTEYLVKNGTLKAAGCHCIQVHTYSGRDADPIDPDYITQKGAIGASGLCVRVSRLGVASPWASAGSPAPAAHAAAD